MKRLLTLPVLSLLFIGWSGYQLFTNVLQVVSPAISQNQLPANSRVTCQIPGFHISLVEKEPDFDDLLEFTSGPGYSVNDAFINKVTDLLPDRTNKENQRASFKCFNREYDSGQDKLLTKYPDTFTCGRISDHYSVTIPVIFLSPKDHPPQILG